MTPKEFGLGRNPSPLDIRDYRLASFMPEMFGDLSGGKEWSFDVEPLDQQATPHCTGFSCADFGINNPIQDAYTNQDGHDFYYKCKLIDKEPNQENGSTVRSVAKVLQDTGRIYNYAFASSINEITYWLLNKGPVIVGTLWTMNMFVPINNVIRPTGDVMGGHCYLLNEKTSDGLYGIQNSWGTRWGVGGKAYISIDDFAILLRNGGEALAAVELPLIPIPKENWFVTLLKILFKIQ